MSEEQVGNKQPFVSVAICTRNRRECLEKYFFPSVFNLAYSNYEIVVVVDDSIDGSELFLQNYKDLSGRLRVIWNRKSNGIAHARNLCAYYARGEIIAFTDDDCLLDANWLSVLVAEFMKNERLMVVGGFTYDGYSNQPGWSSNGIFGCNMAFRKKVFNRFLFDTNLFFHKGPMHEETDLVNRMMRHGYLTGYVPGAVARHFVGRASYRRINKRIGDHLNWIYMNAKSVSWPGYYYKFFKRSYQMHKIIKGLYREGAISFFMACQDILWAIFCLLFELPLKAKIAHWQEERMFNKK